MKIKKTLKNQKGLTLIEIIIYMGLLSILLVVLTDMLVSILDLRLEAQAVSAVDQDGKFILERLTYDVNRADAILVPNNPGDSGNTLTLLIDGVNYTYDLSNEDLTLTNNIGTYNLNGSESTVSGLLFQKLGPGSGKRDSVRINFVINSLAELNKGNEVRSFRTVVNVKK